jgi:hypothetical protein
MKSARFTNLLGVLVLTLVAGWMLAATWLSRGALAEEPHGQWQVVLPKTNVGDKWRMAAFLDENFGITGGAGDVGKARCTSDGGKTWTVADSSGG